MHEAKLELMQEQLEMSYEFIWQFSEKLTQGHSAIHLFL